jgi:CRISPR-associated endonuclease/helicase Cas3
VKEHTSKTTFDEFFHFATSEAVFPFQRRFAEELPSLVNVPTGLGKTAMAILGWLWRRRNEKFKRGTPHRLVYCLPMRVLVEQTRDCARRWIKRLVDEKQLAEPVPVHILMGGERQDDWDMWPERDAVLIGTQDMLLSRALNRGYAASRPRWPMQFGLLNTDCLWIFDEIQLMGSGLATTAQLEAFRHLLGSKDGHGCKSVWMSATMRPAWLETVDLKDRVAGLTRLDLEADDRKNKVVSMRTQARKILKKAKGAVGDPAEIAEQVIEEHKAASLTIVVVNTVRRACEVFDALVKAPRKSKGKSKGRPEAVAPKLVLVHSRFRPGDREKRILEALAPPPPEGSIVVSTQVIEAGVDVSARTLFTELAPWASLVQRFGRCNRRGEFSKDAQVFWIDLPRSEKEAAKLAPPYRLEDLREMGKRLAGCRKGVGPEALPEVELSFEHTHVMRRKDLVDLFDTTPDLSGADIDIDRFVREVEDSDVRVLWREWPQTKGVEPPDAHDPEPQREELCPAHVAEFRNFAKTRRGRIWRWSFVDDRWERVDQAKIVPGQVFLVHSGEGGYTPQRGWDHKGSEPVEPLPPEGGHATDSHEADPLSRTGVWQSIAEHAQDVVEEIEKIVKEMPELKEQSEALRMAARWHDRGKAHHVFQAALPKGPGKEGELWAKAEERDWKRYQRRHFRHELASALAVLDPRNSLIPDDLRDLVAYLVAAHHGKVRLSIRSMPDETQPDASEANGRGRRFARGVWDGDPLPATDLGGGVSAPAVELSLEPMELGLCTEHPFEGKPSWMERMLRLRDERLGPFRLAYFESVLRAADWRASAAAASRGVAGA